MKISVKKILLLALASFALVSCSLSGNKEATANDEFFKYVLSQDSTGQMNFPSDFGGDGDIILPNTGVCDPHIHIFNGKAWMFASHDEGPGNSFYKMHDWLVCSSPDLVHWKIEYVLKPEDTYVGKSESCWATDAAERNGKHYMYFSKGFESTGVVVSENGPGGPYKDVLGKPLLPKELCWNNEYDPSIFIEDDNTPYIVFGFGGDYKIGSTSYQIAKLNDDMISLAEAPRDLDDVAPHVWRDAPSLHKYNGKYYLNTHQSHYAVSDSLYGPYDYRGHCGPPSADHGSFFTWNNQTYYVYGHWYSDFYRYTKIVYCHYKDNGDIVSPEKIGDSPLGVGRYDANWNKIEAEWFFAASDGVRKKENTSGFEMQNLTHGDYLYYPKVRNMASNASMQFQVASNQPNGCTIEVYKDSPKGKLLGSVKVKSTGSWDQYQTVNCSLADCEDLNNIVLVFKGSESDELLRLDWFSFSK